MDLHNSTFQYLKPTDEQMATMSDARDVVETCAARLNHLLPEGPDKTYLIRLLRTVGMWANVAITRMPDGSPRQ